MKVFIIINNSTKEMKPCSCIDSDSCSMFLDESLSIDFYLNSIINFNIVDEIHLVVHSNNNSAIVSSNLKDIVDKALSKEYKVTLFKCSKIEIEEYVDKKNNELDFKKLSNKILTRNKINAYISYIYFIKSSLKMTRDSVSEKLQLEFETVRDNLKEYLEYDDKYSGLLDKYTKELVFFKNNTVNSEEWNEFKNSFNDKTLEQLRKNGISWFCKNGS